MAFNKDNKQSKNKKQKKQIDFQNKYKKTNRIKFD